MKTMSHLGDWLLAGWIVFVGIAYLGGYFVPQIGALTASFGAIYAVMLIVSIIAAWNHWRRRPSNHSKP